MRRDKSPVLALIERAGADELKLIIEKATRLFAEHGYHGITTRQIAAATGLNAATVHRHAGTKRDLYRTVLERLYHEDRALVEAWSARLPSVAVEDAAGAREVIKRLCDRVVEQAVNNPTVIRMYMRRWFDPPDDAAPIEDELFPKVYKPMIDFLERMRARGIVSFQGDFRFFLRGVDGIVAEYFVAGPMTATKFRTNPMDPDKLREFREFLLQYVYRTLGLG